MKKCLAIFIGVVFLSLCENAAGQGQPAAPSGGQSSPQALDTAVQQAKSAAAAAEQQAKAAEQIQQDVKRQAEDTIRRSDDMMARAEFLEKIVTLIGGVPVVIVGILGAIGIGFSYREIKKSAAIAKSAVAEIDKERQNLVAHRLLLTTLNAQVKLALRQIEDALQQSDQKPATALIGTGDAIIPQRAYDDDALIVFADKLNLVTDVGTGSGGDGNAAAAGDVQIAALFLKLSVYWRRVKNYNRAIERSRRAVALDPSSCAAHKALGRSLWNIVGEQLVKSAPAAGSAAGKLLRPSPPQLVLLDESIEHLTKARELLRQNKQVDEELHFDFATVARYRGDMHAAENEYKMGRDLSQSLAQVEGHVPDWDFEFALACLYSQEGRYDEALETLKPVLSRRTSWNRDRSVEEERDYYAWTREDPDFEPMFLDPDWRVKLEALLQELVA